MRYEIPLPRLLDDNGGEVRRVNVVDATVNLNIMPLSTATMTLPDTESVPMRSWVEMYTSQGSAGIFRVRSPGRSFGQGQNSYQLDHGIVEVGDYVIKGESDYDGPANTILPAIWTHYNGSKWKLGSIAASENVTYSTDYGNVLSAIIDIIGQLPNHMLAFDFSTKPWTVSVIVRPQDISGEARLNRNIVSCKISEDDSNLCTRLRCYSNSATLIQTMDADTLSTYGVVEQVAGQDEKQTQQRFLADCTKYLNQHKNPLIAISIDLRDLQAVTGEELDGFTLGSLYRVALPDHSLTYEQTVCTLNWPSVYGDPSAVTVTLGNEELAVNGVYGGSGGAGSASATASSKKAAKTAKDDHIARMEVAGILHEAGLEWDSQHVLMFAKDSATGIGEIYAGVNVAAGKIDLIASTEDLQKASVYKSLFQVHSDQITAEVSRREAGEADMSSRITQTADKIAMKVSKGDVSTELAVELNNVTVRNGNLIVDGYVTADALEAVEASITNMLTGSIAVSRIVGSEAEFSNINASNAITYGGYGNLASLIINSLSSSSSGGTITISSSTLNNSPGPSVNFNIADTQYYKDGVSAAWTNAANTARINNSYYGPGDASITLDSGDSVTVTAQVKANSSAAIYTTVGTVTVTASGGGSYTQVQYARKNLTRYSGGYTELYSYERGSYHSLGTHYWYYINSDGWDTLYEPS